jgi:hypothetical protein
MLFKGIICKSQPGYKTTDVGHKEDIGSEMWYFQERV